MQPSADTLRATIRKALQDQQEGTVTVLSSLLAIEDAIGYIPPEGIEAVAELAHCSENDVWGVASFYPNFRFEPPCDHVVEVCWGPTCHLLGAPNVIKEVLASVGLSSEGDTPDKRISVKFNTCLGACAQAPVMSIDHHLAGRLTPQKARRRMDDLSPAPAHR
ncbi:MAG: NAD(P)H-dependent oxidoreductase subunit E [Chloroflexi bacterium]|nr:NAD(P)H-dependent oxidoreductase subunit E [Chloroflexota bacterium]